MKKILACLILLTAITGCSKEENAPVPKEQNVPTAETAAKPQKEELTLQQQLDFGKRFDQFDFHPRSFEVHIKENKIVLDMDYHLNGKLVKFLSQGIDYSFGIGFPDEVMEVTSLEQTSAQPGPSFKKGDSEGKERHIQFVEEIPNKLTKPQIKELEKNLGGYQLVVLNRENDVVYILDDIYERQKQKDLSKVLQEDLGKVRIEE
ncbi:hypothetical protein P4361_18740 [Fictibacillus sp. B-59209]|uniref:hypothetical protein n=1 Tax=Fictibacillus sp. B-59209 TaxID=3024873 RepID=UPI002E234B0C|nr:hypothetical protein [Fictibacillus sp. B-59209]